ncbi:General L-amino acid-binding periplasmic protein AapJ [Azospirillaceae bacterium]
MVKPIARPRSVVLYAIIGVAWLFVAAVAWFVFEAPYGVAETTTSTVVTNAANPAASPVASAPFGGKSPVGAPPSPTLLAAKQRGKLRCGVSSGLLGFSSRDGAGVWSGFDVDFCRALAAAALGDARNVEYISSNVQKGLAALAAGELDALSRTVTITMKRVTEIGVHPVGVNFIDGQSFLVKRSANIRALHQLSGVSICFQSGTTAEDNLKEVFSGRKVSFKSVAKAEYQEMIQAFIKGECEVLSADSSSLSSIRVSVLPHPEQYVVLRRRISKEPFGPMVRKGDDRWLEIARWTLMAMMEAEELGVKKSNVDAMRAGDNPRVRRLLGVTPGLGQALGLDEAWAYRIIAQVGNYGESFEANLGYSSPLKLDRGLNDSWMRGGLMFSYPLR